MESVNSILRLIAVAIVSANLVACGNPQIRVVNRSAIPLENVRVHFPSQAEDYGTIAPNEATAYRDIERAYATPYIEAIVAGRPARLSPIDHVGDKLLGGGKYTYALTTNDLAESPNERLRFEFIQD